MCQKIGNEVSAFSSCTDEALCRLAASGRREAEDSLAERYYPCVRACARPLFLIGGDSEDLIQEGMLGLLQAIREFNPEKEASFHTFAEVCIRSRLYSALRASVRDKHSPLNRSVSLDASFFDQMLYAPATLDVQSFDPESFVIDREFIAQFLQILSKDLSALESRVLRYYLDGLSCGEIADCLGKTPKSVDNAVQRIRRKAAQRISSATSA